MPFAAPNLLAAVDADGLAAVDRLDRLAVDTGGAGIRVAADGVAGLAAHGFQQGLPGAVDLPVAEVGVDGLPGWQVVRWRSPGAALASDVEQGVEDLAHRVVAGPSARADGRDQGCEHGPLRFREVTRVRFAAHAARCRKLPLLEQSLSGLTPTARQLPVTLAAI